MNNAGRNCRENVTASSPAAQMLHLLPFLLLNANALSECQKSIIFQTTNVFENSQVGFAYDYCEQLHDGRGITSGIIGFTSGTGDAYQVVSAYSKHRAYRNEFDKYLLPMQKLAAKNSMTDSTVGLSGYCRKWIQASWSPVFRAIQRKALESMYFTPSFDLAKLIGLQSAVSLGQFYDCAIQHGIDGPDSLTHIAAMVKLPTPASGGDEIQWIISFMQHRKYILCHPQEAATQQVWCASVSRVNSYMYIAGHNPANFTTEIESLDNDGSLMDIKCDTAMLL